MKEAQWQQKKTEKIQSQDEMLRDVLELPHIILFKFFTFRL